MSWRIDLPQQILSDLEEVSQTCGMHDKTPAYEGSFVLRPFYPSRKLSVAAPAGTPASTTGAGKHNVNRGWSKTRTKSSCGASTQLGKKIAKALVDAS